MFSDPSFGTDCGRVRPSRACRPGHSDRVHRAASEHVLSFARLERVRDLSVPQVGSETAFRWRQRRQASPRRQSSLLVRDQKAALLPFAMAATEATQVSLQAPSVTHLCMPHVLSATRMLRVLRLLACACRYCSQRRYTTTRRCWRLEYIIEDELEAAPARSPQP